MFSTILHRLTAPNLRGWVDPDANVHLNLSYITPRLIAMCFPAQGMEGLYRNQISQVAAGQYKVYNLCLEQSYESSRFAAPVACYPFRDHTPPTLEQIHTFCQDVHAWLEEDSYHVAVIHCKAGKGRTGTMICAYLLFSKEVPSMEDAMRVFGSLRTFNGQGVTIPSQKRYLDYYTQYLHNTTVDLTKCITLQTLTLHLHGCSGELPSWAKYLMVTVYERNANHEYPIATRGPFPLPNYHQNEPSTTGKVVLALPLDNCEVAGDFYIQVFSRQLFRTVTLFHFWLNTAFLASPVREREFPDTSPKELVTLTAAELDDSVIKLSPRGTVRNITVVIWGNP
ncbi:hypothetical protein IWQ61_000149 [Dispira simplex]|nr:hypothetical protein IWQ61_000149 [Dispira simplex]